MDDLKLYLPFEKKDNDQRIVAGYATTEDLDSQGEVVKLAAVERALPDYMKYANIREMHQWSAVGKAIQASVDNTKKGLYLVAKVVDEQAWKKVKEGVYNGFSIGGKVVKKVGNNIEDLVLNEISLVDRPANPSATFSLVKIDMKKKSTGEPGPIVEKDPNYGLRNADRLIQMANALAFMIDEAKAQGMDEGAFTKLIMQLKETIKEQIALKGVYSVTNTYFDTLTKVL